MFSILSTTITRDVCVFILEDVLAFAFGGRILAINGNVKRLNNHPLLFTFTLDFSCLFMRSSGNGLLYRCSFIKSKPILNISMQRSLYK